MLHVSVLLRLPLARLQNAQCQQMSTREVQLGTSNYLNCDSRGRKAGGRCVGKVTAPSAVFSVHFINECDLLEAKNLKFNLVP